MTSTIFHKIYTPIRKTLPSSVASPMRSVATAVLTPLVFSYQTGHFLSSLKTRAVTKDGHPLPWYSYPAIDFLKCRPYRDRSVLEFGGGQSTLWWAARAKEVVTLEGDHAWYQALQKQIPSNVDLNYVSQNSAEECIADAQRTLRAKAHRRYDVIVIDGLYRDEMAGIARELVSDTGMIVCDDAESYGFNDAFRSAGLLRADFVGNSPGTLLPHTTSIFFPPCSFAFDAAHPIGGEPEPVGS